MKKYTNIVKQVAFIFTLSLICTGCSTILTSQRAEPEVIILRNSSNINIKTISLRAAKAEKNQTGIRFGSISPLPVGRDQTIVRPVKSKKLPSILQVSWVDENNRQFIKEVNLKKLLYPANENDRNAIVFEVQSLGVVNIFAEKHPVN